MIYPKIQPRARLIRELEARYFSWADALPPLLGALARDRSTYTGHPGDGPFEGPASINPLIACAPWLFWESFSGLEDGVFLDIAEAGAYLTLASGVMDHLVDGQYPNPVPLTLFYQAIYDSGITLFRRIFPPDSPFWPNFDRLNRDYMAALAAEIETQQGLQPFPFAHFDWFAGGKVTPMAITLAALTAASAQPHLLAPIETSLRKSYVAGQLLDDTLDWEKDLGVGHVTYVLTLLAQAAEELQLSSETNLGGPPVATAGVWPSSETLLTANQRRWIDTDALGLSVAEFENALAAVSEVDCPFWVTYLEEYRDIAKEYRRGAMAGHLADVFTVLAEREPE